MRWSGPEQQRKPFQKSAGPVKPARNAPPYLPISFSGLMTSGSWPMRSATGGSLPALTSAASCGASFSVLGIFAASVTTSGPSSLPMRPLLAIWARAPAASTVVSSPTMRAITIRDLRWRVRGVRPRSVMTRPPLAAALPFVRALTAALWPRPRPPTRDLYVGGILPRRGHSVKRLSEDGKASGRRCSSGRGLVVRSPANRFRHITIGILQILPADTGRRPRRALSLSSAAAGCTFHPGSSIGQLLRTGVRLRLPEAPARWGQRSATYANENIPSLHHRVRTTPPE